MLNKVRSYDKFGAPVGLNFRGAGGYQTIGGGMVTLLYYTFFIMYLCFQLVAVTSFASPQITSY